MFGAMMELMNALDTSPVYLLQHTTQQPTVHQLSLLCVHNNLDARQILINNAQKDVNVGVCSWLGYSLSHLFFINLQALFSCNLVDLACG